MKNLISLVLCLFIDLALIAMGTSLSSTFYFVEDEPDNVYWCSIGDDLPVDVHTLAAVPSDTPSQQPAVYVGVWGSGLYRSTDHGATWVTATAGLTLPMYVRGGLAVNPVTPTVLFAGDYYGGLSRAGIYRSTDGGDSWDVVLRDANIEALLVHPLTPTLVFAGDREDGLYRSADGGDSWEPVSPLTTHVQSLVASPIPPGLVYLGAGNELYVSANSGISWTLASMLSSTVESLAVHPTTPTLLYAGTRRHGAWRSADGGSSWITQTAGLPADAWVRSIAIHPITPTILYAGVWQGQVYRSADGGDTWQDLGYLGNVETVLIHPTAPSVIYAGTSNNGLFRGSTLHHLTMASIASPQYVNRAFPITLTACDELGFPITGPPQAQLAVLAESDPALAATLSAGGYDGTATLADTTGTISPTLVTFVDGVATTDVVITAPVESGGITATIPGGPAVNSNPFDVIEGDVYVYLPLVIKAQ